MAALLAAQRKGGAISDDVRVHALATWALAEAALRCKDEPWVARASKAAAAHLASLGEHAEAERKRWVRLVLAPVSPSRKPAGGPLDRLCANARRGHLSGADHAVP